MCFISVIGSKYQALPFAVAMMACARSFSKLRPAAKKACFDFCTEKMGLVAVWGDRNGPYTSFATKEGEPPCFAIFSGANLMMFKGYKQPNVNIQSDTVVAVIPSDDLDKDY